jgi:hypothetical protein
MRPSGKFMLAIVCLLPAINGCDSAGPSLCLD